MEKASYTTNVRDDRFRYFSYDNHGAKMKNHSTQEPWPINQIFIFIATSLIILYLLKLASNIVVPFLISISLAIILSPFINYLESKFIPKIVSLLLVVLLALFPIIIVSEYIVNEILEFASNYESIKTQFIQYIVESASNFHYFGITIDKHEVNMFLEQSNLTDIIKNLLTEAKNQFSNIFLIFFMVSFMLLESSDFHNKILKISKAYDINPHLFIEILEKVKSYFILKVKTSFITGLWALLILWYYDISYYYLWAVLAFFLNFIPVIGSILAAIPAVAFALVDHGSVIAMWIIVWYVIINTLIGNILEPRLMGKGLGISPLVIFLSMTFWGLLFGPAGMILSVPLTMVSQYLFDQYKETRWIALLLSEYKKKS